MTRRRHLAAPFAPVVALLFAGCASFVAGCAAQSAPVASSSTMADRAPSGAVAAADASSNDLEGQIAALGAAEAQIARAIHVSLPGMTGKDADRKKAEDQERAREPSSLATASPSSPPPLKAGQSSMPGVFRAGDDGMGGADACTTACSALSSMERAARHLCNLTGDGDARCDNARSRVSGASERVMASCPACSTSN